MRARERLTIHKAVDEALAYHFILLALPPQNYWNTTAVEDANEVVDSCFAGTETNSISRRRRATVDIHLYQTPRPYQILDFLQIFLDM